MHARLWQCARTQALRWKWLLEVIGFETILFFFCLQPWHGNSRFRLLIVCQHGPLSNFRLQVMLSRVTPTFSSGFWDPEYADSPIVAAETVLVAEVTHWHSFSHGVKYCKMSMFNSSAYITDAMLPKTRRTKQIGAVNDAYAGVYPGTHSGLPCLHSGASCESSSRLSFEPSCGRRKLKGNLAPWTVQ